MDISKIDKNFAIETKINREVVFFDAEEKPVSLHGIFKEEGDERFVRIPASLAVNVNKGVNRLNYNTAGGRARFKTNSKYIAIHTKMNAPSIMTHQAPAGSAGFDLYVNDGELGERYLATYRPPIDVSDGFEGVVDTGFSDMREYTIHFPTYSGVNKLYIGLEPNALIEEPSEYTNKLPVVYYGSSITQGGCVSKPGDTYQDVLSRRFNIDYINLGFAGSAIAEDNIIDYINNLDMSIFVYDYDHNSPNPNHLKQTHEKAFLKIREKHPELPIIMMTRPRYVINADTEARLEVIKETYRNAKNRGDENVYLVTGRELMSLCKNEMKTFIS